MSYEIWVGETFDNVWQEPQVKTQHPKSAKQLLGTTLPAPYQPGKPDQKETASQEGSFFTRKLYVHRQYIIQT